MVTESWESLLHAAARDPASQDCSLDAGHGPTLSWNAMLKALGQNLHKKAGTCNLSCTPGWPSRTSVLEGHTHQHAVPLCSWSTTRPANSPDETSAGTSLYPVLRGPAPGCCNEQFPFTCLQPTMHYGCPKSERGLSLRHGCKDCGTCHDLPHMAPHATKIVSSSPTNLSCPLATPGAWEEGYMGPTRDWQTGKSELRSSTDPCRHQGISTGQPGTWKEVGNKPPGSPQGKSAHGQEWDGETFLASPRTAIQNLCRPEHMPAEATSNLRKEEKSAPCAADKGDSVATESYLARPANAHPSCTTTDPGKPNPAVTWTRLQHIHSSTPLNALGGEGIGEEPHSRTATIQQFRAGMCHGLSLSPDVGEKATAPQDAGHYSSGNSHRYVECSPEAPSLLHAPAPRWLPPWRPNSPVPVPKREFPAATCPQEDISKPSSHHADGRKRPGVSRITPDCGRSSLEGSPKQSGSPCPLTHCAGSLGGGHEGGGAREALVPQKSTARPQKMRQAVGASPGCVRGVADGGDGTCGDKCERSGGKEGAEKTVDVLRDLLDRERAVSRAARQRVRELEADGHEGATEEAAQLEAARLDNLWLRSLVRRLQDSSQLPDAFRQYEAKLERAQRHEEQLQGEIRRQRRQATQLRAQGRMTRPVSSIMATAKALAIAQPSNGCVKCGGGSAAMTAAKQQLAACMKDRAALRKELDDAQKEQRLHAAYRLKADDGLRRVAELQRQVKMKELQLQKARLAAVQATGQVDLLQAEVERLQAEGQNLRADNAELQVKACTSLGLK